MKDASLLPVALFDSGVGGLTVLKALADRLPGEDLLYLGDTARLPYGTKGRETITRYTLLAAQKLVDRGAKMLVPKGSISKPYLAKYSWFAFNLDCSSIFKVTTNGGFKYWDSTDCSLKRFTKRS